MEGTDGMHGRGEGLARAGPQTSEKATQVMPDLQLGIFTRGGGILSALSHFLSGIAYDNTH